MDEGDSSANPPKSKEERIKEILLSERRGLDEENFEEALGQVYQVCREGKVSSNSAGLNEQEIWWLIQVWVIGRFRRTSPSC